MTRRQYLAEVIRLYLGAEETPSRAARRDWAVAGDLYQKGVPVQHLAHAMRVASLRRRFHLQPPLETVRSLAYYRAVLERLDAEHLDPDYVDYVQDVYRRNRLSHDSTTKPRSYSQNAAQRDRR